MTLVACQAAPSPSASATAQPSPVVLATASVAPTSTISPGPTETATPTAAPPLPGGIYAASVTGVIAPALADIPPRVWVPNERGSEVVAIDPVTFRILTRLQVGAYPEHISPSWDGQLLYVNDMHANQMSIIDPRKQAVVGTVKTPAPYNLYFTPDGTRAIVVEDFAQGAPQEENGLRFYSWPDWRELAFVPIRWAGADHLDFSADGTTLYLSCEFSGRVEVVDVRAMKVVKDIVVGGFATDVRLAPDGTRLFVANQQLNGVSVIDTTTNTLADFIPLKAGSHGLALSRDATRLFVTNRLAGSMSVIDIATLKVVATWKLGGSPDMIAVSADGSQLWISNRWDRSVVVVDSATGKVLKEIETGARPHGLAFWPLPGRYSLGHNGNMR